MTEYDALLKLTDNGKIAIQAWSPAFGWLKIYRITESIVSCHHKTLCRINFNRDLTILQSDNSAKQMLFPNEKKQDWVSYLYEMKPEEKFKEGEMVAFEHSDNTRYFLARIARIIDSNTVIISVTTPKGEILNMRTCLKNMYKLTEMAKLLKVKETVKDVQSI